MISSHIFLINHVFFTRDLEFTAHYETYHPMCYQNGIVGVHLPLLIGRESFRSERVLLIIFQSSVEFKKRIMTDKASFDAIKEGNVWKCRAIKENEKDEQKRWNLRWFILQENVIYYFKNIKVWFFIKAYILQWQEDTTSRGTILLSDILEVSELSTEQAQFNGFPCFKIHTSDRTFYASCYPSSSNSR